MAQGLVDSSFQYHLMSAKKNGITKTEIAEVLTHAAFYAGWPKAWAAFDMAKEVWAEGAAPEDAMAAHAASMVFPIGAPNDAYAEAYFTGKSYLAPVSSSQVGIYNVTFEPGPPQQLAHPPRENRRRADSCLRGRKRLLSGSGQARAAARPRRCRKHSARRSSTGTGAAPDSWFSPAFLAVEVPGAETSNEWCEPVTDEAYPKL